MGWREGIEMGLSLSNAYNRDKLQNAELAQANEKHKREQGLWQATDQAGQDTQAQIDQARGRTALPTSEIGLSTPVRDPRVLRQGGYADEQSQAPQEQLGFGPAHEQALGRLQQKAKIAQAAGDHRSLLGVQDELRQLQMDAGSAAIKNRITNANADELGAITKTVSDNKRNNWQMKVDPKTGITTVSNGGESVSMNKDQLGDLIAARWRLKQGDTTAGEAIAKIHKSFADEGSGQLATIGSIAKINNDAAKSVSDATYKAGMLSAAQTNAQANMIRAQRPAGSAGNKGGGEGKALPVSAATGILENQRNLVRAQTALSLINGDSLPGVGAGDANATGVKGYLPNQVLNRIDPQGVDTRAAIADLGSLVIHDRSGAAVTAAEFPRLAPFIPTEKDDPATVRKKLNQFVKNYQAQVDETSEFYRQSGYNVPTQVFRQGGDQPPKGNPTAPAAPVRPAAPAKGQVYKGHRFLGGDPADRNSWEVAR